MPKATRYCHSNPMPQAMPAFRRSCARLSWLFRISSRNPSSDMVMYLHSTSSGSRRRYLRSGWPMYVKVSSLSMHLDFALSFSCWNGCVSLEKRFGLYFWPYHQHISFFFQFLTSVEVSPFFELFQGKVIQNIIGWNCIPLCKSEKSVGIISYPPAIFSIPPLLAERWQIFLCY